MWWTGSLRKSLYGSYIFFFQKMSRPYSLNSDGNQSNVRDLELVAVGGAGAAGAGAELLDGDEPAGQDGAAGAGEADVAGAGGGDEAADRVGGQPAARDGGARGVVRADADLQVAVMPAPGGGAQAHLEQLLELNFF